MQVTYSVGATVPGGGIGNVAYHSLKALSEENYLQKAFLTFLANDFLKSNKVHQFTLLNKIPSYLIKDNLFDLLVSRHIEATDIFHGWNNFSLFSLRVAKKKGAKVVIERASSHIMKQHELLKKEMKKFGLNYDPVNPLTLKKSIQEYQEADFVFVPSDFAYQSFLELGFPKEKLKVIQFGVDLTKFTPKKSKSDETFRAIFVGQVGIRKGLPYLMQAWQELDLQNSELLIIGPIFPDFKDMVKNYQTSKVRFVEYSNNLAEFYSQSDVFVFPSVEEGSALVTYEAMAAGLPVITTFNSGSVVENGKEGFIHEVGDVAALKEAIFTLYKDKNLLNKFSQQARKKIENYSWEKYEDNLIKAYEEILRT